MIEEEKKTEEEKKPGAKSYSLFAQIFSALWIAALFIIKGLGKLDLDTTDIIYTGIAITAIFSPVYISIFLEKIRDIRFGK